MPMALGERLRPGKIMTIEQERAIIQRLIRKLTTAQDVTVLRFLTELQKQALYDEHRAERLPEIAAEIARLQVEEAGLQAPEGAK